MFNVSSVFLLALFLAVATERLVEHFVEPVVAQLCPPEWRSTSLRLASLIIGGIFSFLFGIDLFYPMLLDAGIVPFTPLATTALTAVLVGGGSNLLHDLWPK